jgi:predicted nucleic acid-binding protein
VIVVDVNILIYLLADVPERAQAVALVQHDADCRLPALRRHEFLNVLATLTRSAYLEAADAAALWQHAQSFCEPMELEPDPLAALQLSVGLGISGYDAQYLALAEQLEVPLVTNDRRLIQRAGGRAYGLKEILGGKQRRARGGSISICLGKPDSGGGEGNKPDPDPALLAGAPFYVGNWQAKGY